jgi:uncharacterized protein YjeT (DUF2065 family)
LERSTELAAAAVLLLAGLSQMYAARLWLAYYRGIVARGPLAMRLHGLAGGAIGAGVLRLHAVWSGAGAMLTFLAVLMTAEGAICLIAPKFGLVKLAALDEQMKARTLFFTWWSSPAFLA